VDEWINSVSNDRDSIDPAEVPWDALRTLISESIFGGKIDNDYDQKILNSLVNQFFSKDMYHANFTLFTPNSENQSEKVLTLPENFKTHAEFFNWIARETMSESPAWSGLPANAEMRVRAENARVLLKEFKEM
jgi:dynein heavy chain 1